MLGRKKRHDALPDNKLKTGDPRDLSQTRSLFVNGRYRDIFFGNSVMKADIIENYRDTPDGKIFNIITSAATQCAILHMGEGAESSLFATTGSDAYIMPSGDIENLQISSDGFTIVERVVGPLAVRCTDAFGSGCPKAETCKSVNEFSSNVFIRGGLAKLELPTLKIAPSVVAN